MENFSEKLNSALKEKGMNKSQLCLQIGMTLNGLNKSIENNTMKIETLELICKILDVPISQFLDIRFKPEGFWQTMIDDLMNEIKDLRLKNYQAKEMLKQNGINFHNVSKQGGVLPRPIFLASYQRVCLRTYAK